MESTVQSEIDKLPDFIGPRTREILTMMAQGLVDNEGYLPDEAVREAVHALENA